MRISIAVLLCLISFVHVTKAQNEKFTIKVTVKPFDVKGNGIVYGSLFNPEEKSIKIAKSSIVNKGSELIFSDIPKGKYAVKLFYDENNNKKIDKNFMGMPTEHWACSNNVKARFGPPVFKEMLFEVNTDKKIEVIMN